MSGIDCRVECKSGIVNETCEICSLKAKTSHGKLWEKKVCKYVLTEFGYKGDEPDFHEIFKRWEKNSDIDTTAPHDIDAKLMGINWDQIPLQSGETKSSMTVKEKYGDGISVKLIKKGCDICMGKLSRIWEHFNHGPWSMIVGFYIEKVIEGVKCLCIEKVYYIPFIDRQSSSSLPQRPVREAFFGAVPDNFPEKIKELESKVKEAWSYKKGARGVNGLTDPNIPIVPFDELNEKEFQKIEKLRKLGGTDSDSSPQDILAAAESCKDVILSMQSKLQPNANSPSRVAVKLSNGNSRVQGRVNYKNFLKLAQEIGSDITNDPNVVNNNVTLPIKKMNKRNAAAPAPAPAPADRPAKRLRKSEPGASKTGGGKRKTHRKKKIRRKTKKQRKRKNKRKRKTRRKTTSNRK